MLTLLKFQEIYSRFQSSGLRVRDFCQNEGLHESKFYYWQKKLHSSSSERSDFIPLVFNRPASLPVPSRDLPPMPPSSLSPTASYYPCEIVYPCGTVLRLSAATDIELLRKLLLLTP